MPNTVGTQVTLSVRWVDDDGQATDPTTVTGVVTDPTGAETTLTVTNPETGLYEAPFTSSEVGRHAVEWTAAGTIVGTRWDGFTVHDGLKEARGGPFPAGLQSWETAVR